MFSYESLPEEIVFFLTFQVILMSATFNVQRFAEYFSFPLFGKLAPAPVIYLDKYPDQKTSFKIHEYYLCQLGLQGKVSLLHVCKLDQPFLHEAILCDPRIILKPFGGWHCKRRAVCVQMCFEASYFHE